MWDKTSIVNKSSIIKHVASTLTTRYTHKYRAFEVSRLGFPINHSGQNVMNLYRVSIYISMLAPVVGGRATHTP